jgi:hypothetical protein
MSVANRAKRFAIRSRSGYHPARKRREPRNDNYDLAFIPKPGVNANAQTTVRGVLFTVNRR